MINVRFFILTISMYVEISQFSIESVLYSHLFFDRINNANVDKIMVLHMDGCSPQNYYLFFSVFFKV